MGIPEEGPASDPACCHLVDRAPEGVTIEEYAEIAPEKNSLRSVQNHLGHHCPSQSRNQAHHQSGKKETSGSGVAAEWLPCQPLQTTITSLTPVRFITRLYHCFIQISNRL